MRKPTLVFIDIDGTLLDSSHRIPDSAREECCRAQRAGHRLFICSGRAALDIDPPVLELGFDGIVSDGGACAELDGETVIDERMPDESVRMATSFFNTHGMPYAWHCPDGMHATVQYLYRSGIGKKLLRYPRMHDGLHAIADPSVPLQAVRKGTFYIPEDGSLTVKDVRRELAGYATIIHGSLNAASNDNGEILIPGVNKGTALVQVAQRLGVPLSDTIAIGDSDNDLEMIQDAGIGVAMGNGTASVKAVADMVAPNVNNDGLAAALRQLLR
ncbi:Cof-type HAD-IIB family hydrolase [Bifidobacterium avesanii]|uniref:Cof-type HAD-IIB family hydrolase n=1 Tax=Bifidobacterium avesanii TaxID=1798157 RepID=A0A7K3TGE6_9BIFI|nr:Cof-type HAD-IIB family hydrolase [Bifidobacterium avesanii]KAB8295686.1 hydrolase [Bifidobacterium avesanii]NEG77690.1 Cof-type HAD-IIB family hydrolase [Bifidobacterium avesanii]